MAVKFCFYLPRKKESRGTLGGLEFKTESSEVTAILIHGLTGAPHEMKFPANFLYRKGYTVLCPRLAHHGEPLSVLKWAKWPEFYQSVKEALLKVPPSQKVVVAGQSMGALLALLLASEFPDRISRVTCISPTLFYDGWNVPWSHRLLPLAYYTPVRYFAYYKEVPPYGIKNEKVRKRVREYYNNASLLDDEKAAQCGYAYFPVTLFCEMRKLIGCLKKKLPSVRIPVQLIQAYEDDMTSVRNSQYIYDRISSEEKEIQLLYNTYHVITADQERETAAEKMYEFFTRSERIPSLSR